MLIELTQNKISPPVVALALVKPVMPRHAMQGLVAASHELGHRDGEMGADLWSSWLMIVIFNHRQY